MTPASPAPNPSTADAHVGLSGKSGHPLTISSKVQSTDLFKGQKSVVIEHNGASYRLQTTKLGKLILTK
jgi:hemin uptake protein HemP